MIAKNCNQQGSIKVIDMLTTILKNYLTETCEKSFVEFEFFRKTFFQRKQKYTITYWH